MIAQILERILPAIFSLYLLQNISNPNEFGLFYQCVPNKTYHFKNEKMAVGNVNRERLPMFVIGKSKTPTCFKGVKNTPYCYRAQPKSWISSELFEEWFKQIDRNIAAQKRKIVLIIDNWLVQPDVPALGWLELIFLTPNKITQPMDK